MNFLYLYGHICRLCGCQKGYDTLKYVMREADKKMYEDKVSKRTEEGLV